MYKQKMCSFLLLIFSLLSVSSSTHAMKMNSLTRTVLHHQSKNVPWNLETLLEDPVKLIIQELRTAKTGTDAVKNLYRLSIVSKKLNLLVKYKRVTQSFIEYLLSHYNDINKKLLINLTRFTNTEA